jgi:hypothetical protein
VKAMLIVPKGTKIGPHLEKDISIVFFDEHINAFVPSASSSHEESQGWNAGR